MKFSEQKPVSLSESLAPLKAALSRYGRISWPPALVVAVLVGVISIKIPDYFVANVMLFIQPQKISSKIVEAPERAEQQERFEALIHELLSRPRLSSIIDKHDLYPEYRGVAGKERALRKLRKDIKITPAESPSGKELTQTYNVSYRHSNARTAYDVTKELSNLFIEESILNQRTETRSTEEFIDAQLREAKKRLEQTEAEVQKFVRENVGKLPEHKEAAMAGLESAQRQLASNSQLIQANTARLSYLEKELQLAMREATALSGLNNNQPTSSTPEVALAQLERGLAVLKSKYSDLHPDVINTKKRIDSLKQQIKAGGGSRSASAVIANPEARNIRREINELNVSIKTLKEENMRLKEHAEQLDREIRAMPLKEQELIGIRREYVTVKEAYERLLAAKEEAKLQSSLVTSQKATQFRIVDPPSVPPFPSGPPRLIIAAAGLVVAFLVYLLLPVALYVINDSFKFRDEVQSELGVAVVGVIPPLATPASFGKFRRGMVTSIAASTLSLVGGTAIILLVL